MSAQRNAVSSGPVPVSSDEFQVLLAASSNPMVVEVSAEWCPPCRKLAPIMSKLAIETGIPVFTIDGDTDKRFTETYDVRSFPQLLFFSGGRLVERHEGFSGANETRKMLADFPGISIKDPPCGAELAFQKACQEAESHVEEIMSPASDAVAPHIEATTPQIEALRGSLSEARAAGRLTATEASERFKAELAALYAPFQDKIDALRSAQNRALEVYEGLMSQAVENYARDHLRPRQRTAASQLCAPGDPFCRVD